eukprot:CAMPEP_0203899990 /NCGR_PEP_ID=MMETSP0359-20131031/42324_1 /ASSEMBLY_ACC=CAM_ASM_000338 /TAXON_ID=268821 /ORGANISM="Scrippsiella Hangoei, Strain SHTV-5" /LENGTH=51 /DNA_ID=CAMNT_0050823353 /DNA_START=205 /DNA_END=357 /DNA_ORIENTATION=+
MWKRSLSLNLSKVNHLLNSLAKTRHAKAHALAILQALTTEPKTMPSGFGDS